MAATTETVKTEQPLFYLVVIHPFADYQRGSQITDAKTIAEILNSDYAANCNKIQAGG